MTFCSRTNPLENLFPPNILQPAIQIPHLIHQLVHLALIRTLNLARLANNHVKRQLHVAHVLATDEPSTGGGRIGGLEAELVLAAVGRAECEASLGRAALVHDAVVVVECFVDGDGHAQRGIELKFLGLRVELLGFEVACVMPLAVHL